MQRRRRDDGGGTEGAAIIAALRPVRPSTAATVAILSGSKAAGIEGSGAPVSVSNTSVNLRQRQPKGSGIGIELGSAALSNDSVVQGGANTNAIGVGLFLPGSATLRRRDGEHDQPSQQRGRIAPGARARRRYEHIEVGGVWQGSAFQGEGGEVTIADSRLTESPAGTAPALGYFGLGDEPRPGRAAHGHAGGPQTAFRARSLAINANATLDSSEVLGGVKGVFFQHGGEQGTHAHGRRRRRSTPANPASPTDRRRPRRRSGVGRHGQPSRTSRSRARSCSSSRPPASSAPEATPPSVDLHRLRRARARHRRRPATEGAIACASGRRRQHAQPNRAALFAAPITDYQLNPSSSGGRQRARGRDLAAVRPDAVEPPTSRATRAWWTATATASRSRTGARSSCRATPRRARPRPRPAPPAPETARRRASRG